MTDIKKNLIVIVLLLSVTMIALLFLNLNKSWKERSALILETQDKSLINLPKKISKGSVNFFSLDDYYRKILFYDESDSMIYETDFDGSNKKEVTRIPGLSEISFGPTGKKIVAGFSKNGNSKKIYFDLEKNVKTALDSNIRSAAFSPDGTRLVYYFYDGRLNEGNISISNPDGSDFKIIFKTRIKNLEVLWPGDDLIVFYSKTEQNPSAFSVSPQGNGLQRLSEEELSSYSDGDPDKKEILESPGITALKAKISLFDDYIVFINAADGKLYSLRL